MKRHPDFHVSASSPLGDRDSFLELLLSEDLDALSAEIGVSARTLSQWRGTELRRVMAVVGGLPGEDQIVDRDVFERRRAG